jgi:hypothetical protein
MDLEEVGGDHPIQGLRRIAVGVDGESSIGLDHDETSRLGEMGVQPTGIVDGATGDDQSHEALVGEGNPPPGLCPSRRAMQDEPRIHWAIRESHLAAQIGRMHVLALSSRLLGA